MTSDAAPQLGKQASPLPKADLASKFAAPPPNRTEGVPRMAPPPAVAAQPATPAAVPSPAPAAQAGPVGEHAAGPARAGRARPRKAAGRTKRHPSSVVVYLSTSLRARLRAHAAATGRSHTLIVFDALNTHHARLGELVAAVSAAAAEPVVDGLFVIQPTGHRVHEEDQVQVSIRPNPHNLDVIDALTERHAAGNRSALIAAALDAFLPPLSR